MLIPIDASNTWEGGSLQPATSIIYQVLFALIFVMLTIVLPFTWIYNETKTTNDTPGIGRQVLVASLGVAAIVIFSVVLILITYFAIPNINHNIPNPQVMTASTVANQSFFFYNQTLNPYQFGDSYQSIFIFALGWFSLVSWVVFVFAGGCGMVALPIHCCYGAFSRKLKRLDVGQYMKAKKILVKEAIRIINEGQELDELQRQSRWIPNVTGFRRFNKFKKDVNQLEDDLAFVEACAKKGATSFFYVIGMILGGTISSILSLIWMSQILTNFIGYGMGNSFYGYLNYVMEAFEGLFPPVSWFIFIVLYYYLVLVTAYGLIRIGSNLPFLPAITLKYKNTPINSMVVIFGLVLLATIAITHGFCMSFNLYLNRPLGNVPSFLNVSEGNPLYIIFIAYINYSWMMVGNTNYAVGIIFFYIPFAFFAMSLLGLLLAPGEIIYYKYLHHLIFKPKGKVEVTAHDQLMNYIDSCKYVSSGITSSASSSGAGVDGTSRIRAARGGDDLV